MDLEDMAQLQELENIKYALQVRKKKEILVPNGECHYCFEEVGPKQLFCNRDCADKYYTYKKINGS